MSKEAGMLLLLMSMLDLSCETDSCETDGSSAGYGAKEGCSSALRGTLLPGVSSESVLAKFTVISDSKL